MVADAVVLEESLGVEELLAEGFELGLEEVLGGGTLLGEFVAELEELLLEVELFHVGEGGIVG